jgi:hypothetical protein
LRGAVHRLHVLSRRARASQTRAKVPDALLSHGLAGRRRRGRPGRYRRPSRSARQFRADWRLSCVRCC